MILKPIIDRKYGFMRDYAPPPGTPKKREILGTLEDEGRVAADRAARDATARILKTSDSRQGEDSEERNHRQSLFICLIVF